MCQIESAVNRPSFEAKVIFAVTAGVGGGVLVGHGDGFRWVSVTFQAKLCQALLQKTSTTIRFHRILCLVMDWGAVQAVFLPLTNGLLR